jgi:hypothetical protein
MKTFLLVAFVVLIVLILFNRDRVYVRDPLASVYRTEARKDPKAAAPTDKSDEVKQADVQVYINYENDVLLVQKDQSGEHRTLLQNWSRMPGTPTELHCLRWTACMTDADHAPTIPVNWTGKGTYAPQVRMSDIEVSYVDGAGAAIRIVLR